MNAMVRRLTSISLGALGVSVLLLPLTSPKLVAPVPRPADTAAQTNHSSFDGTAFAATARALEPYLVRRPEGTLFLDAPPAVTNKLNAGYVKQLELGLGFLNSKILAGEMRTTPNGAVFEPRSDRFVLQSGWTGFGWTWWHEWWCLSHEDVQAMMNPGWWAMSGAAIGVIAALSSAVGASIGATVGLFGGWMYVADQGRGSCLNAYPAPPPLGLWVTSQ